MFGSTLNQTRFWVFLKLEDWNDAYQVVGKHAKLVCYLTGVFGGLWCFNHIASLRVTTTSLLSFFHPFSVKPPSFETFPNPSIKDQPPSSKNFLVISPLQTNFFQEHFLLLNQLKRDRNMPDLKFYTLAFLNKVSRKYNTVKKTFNKTQEPKNVSDTTSFSL